MSKPTGTYPLPPAILSQQISTLDLLLAMFDPSELEISNTDLALMTLLRDQEDEPVSSTPPEISLAIHVTLDSTHSIQINVTAPLRSPETDPLEPPSLCYTLRQPQWLGRAAITALSAKLPEDIFLALETLREEASSLIPTSPSTSTSTSERQISTEPIVRVWFYFPSLSTREKRNDMVSWAPSHSLTGFVLAGKPGLLCLEGLPKNIDKYMNEIKTVSWGDIPSHQKKVSERYREMVEKRAFDGMQEITGTVGERHGQRANRGDMAALETWLKDLGLGEAFENVILQSS